MELSRGKIHWIILIPVFTLVVFVGLVSLSLIQIKARRPEAKIAEIVVNPLPKDRRRDDVHKHSLFYAVRNYLIDFLVTRSRTFNDEIRAGRTFDPKKPLEVHPSTSEPTLISPLRAAPSYETTEKRLGRA